MYQRQRNQQVQGAGGPTQLVHAPIRHPARERVHIRSNNIRSDDNSADEREHNNDEGSEYEHEISLDRDVSAAFFDDSSHAGDEDELDAYRRQRDRNRRLHQYGAPSPFALAQPSPRPPATTHPSRYQAALPQRQQHQHQQAPAAGQGLPANAAVLPGQQAPQGQQGRQRRQQGNVRGGGGAVAGAGNNPRGRQNDDDEMDQSVEDEDEDKDSNYQPSITERQKRIRNAFGDIFDNDEGGSGVPCFACEVLRGNIHSIKHSKLVDFMLQITARDRIMTYDVFDYTRIANTYEEQIRQPHNRRLKPGQMPLPPFPASRIYQHINRPHIKNRHLRMELLVHDMFDLAEEMKDELRVEHISMRHVDGRPVKRTRKKTLQGFNTLLVQLKHYNSYLDSVPAESRLEALQATALSTAGYGTERLLDNLADHREDLLAEMMGRDGLGNIDDGGGPARKRARHR